MKRLIPLAILIMGGTLMAQDRSIRIWESAKQKVDSASPFSKWTNRTGPRVGLYSERPVKENLKATPDKELWGARLNRYYALQSESQSFLADIYLGELTSLQEYLRLPIGLKAQVKQARMQKLRKATDVLSEAYRQSDSIRKRADSLVTGQPTKQQVLKLVQDYAELIKKQESALSLPESQEYVRKTCQIEGSFTKDPFFKMSLAGQGDLHQIGIDPATRSAVGAAITKFFGPPQGSSELVEYIKKYRNDLDTEAFEEKAYENFIVFDALQESSVLPFQAGSFVFTHGVATALEVRARKNSQSSDSVGHFRKVMAEVLREINSAPDSSMSEMLINLAKKLNDCVHDVHGGKFTWEYDQLINDLTVANALDPGLDSCEGGGRIESLSSSVTELTEKFLDDQTPGKFRRMSPQEQIKLMKAINGDVPETVAEQAVSANMDIIAKRFEGLIGSFYEGTASTWSLPPTVWPSDYSDQSIRNQKDHIQQILDDEVIEKYSKAAASLRPDELAHLGPRIITMSTSIEKVQTDRDPSPFVERVLEGDFDLLPALEEVKTQEVSAPIAGGGTVTSIDRTYNLKIRYSDDQIGDYEATYRIRQGNYMADPENSPEKFERIDFKKIGD